MRPSDCSDDSSNSSLCEFGRNTPLRLNQSVDMGDLRIEKFGNAVLLILHRDGDRDVIQIFLRYMDHTNHATCKLAFDPVSCSAQ